MSREDSSHQSTFSSPLINALRKTKCSEHLDLNITRALHWQDEFSAYEQHYIDEAYEWQLYLDVLGTHPDYDGRGYGAAQCELGKEWARQRGANVTLIATPPGYQLYSTIGFESLANLTFTKVGGGFLTWYEVMKFDTGVRGEWTD